MMRLITLIFLICRLKRFSAKPDYIFDYLMENCANMRAGRNFLIVHFNVRSYSLNFDEFNILLECVKLQPSITVLTKTLFFTNTYTSIHG